MVCFKCENKDVKMRFTLGKKKEVLCALCEKCSINFLIFSENIFSEKKTTEILKHLLNGKTEQEKEDIKKIIIENLKYKRIKKGKRKLLKNVGINLTGIKKEVVK